VADTWNTKTPSNYSWGRPEVVVFEGKIYAVGGGVLRSGANLGYVACYDPKADAWSSLTSMPTPRDGVKIVVYQNQLYCIGGYVPNMGTVFVSRYVNVVEVYDPNNDSWSKKASVPIENGIIQACVVNEQLFVIVQQGGLLEMYLYNIDTDLWMKTANPPLDTFPHATGAFVVAVNSKIIIGTHPKPYPSTGRAQFSISIYDPETDKWSEGKPSSKTAYFYDSLFVGVTTGVYASTKVYVFGYEYLDVEINERTNTSVFITPPQEFTWVYDPEENVWSTAKAVSPPHFVGQFEEFRPIIKQGSAKLVVVDDLFYMMGSDNNYAPKLSRNFNLQYVPIGYLSDGEVSSEPNPSLNTIFIVTTVLAISLTTIGALLYLKKRSKIGGK
jgi:N-acetylneuraminic acid mutarotase